MEVIFEYMPLVIVTIFNCYVVHCLSDHLDRIRNTNKRVSDLAEQLVKLTDEVKEDKNEV